MFGHRDNLIHNREITKTRKNITHKSSHRIYIDQLQPGFPAIFRPNPIDQKPAGRQKTGIGSLRNKFIGI